MADRVTRSATVLRPLVGLLLAALGLGGSCEALDYSLPYVVEVDTTDGQPPSVHLFEQPEIGRVALDWAVTNQGGTDAVFVLDVQAQTAGSPDDEACEVFDGDPSELVAGDVADPEGGAIPLVRDLDRFYRVELMEVDATFAGVVNLRAPTSTVYELRFDRSELDVTLETETGVAVVPDSIEVADGSCASVQTRVTVRLDSGVYRLSLAGPDDRVGMVASEACTEQRTVWRTCPGEASDVVRVDTGLLAPGASVAGRVSTSQLGVGDRVAVLLGCSDATPTCAAVGELFVVTEYLECRSTVDCAGNESCSEDGYCVRQPQQGCAASPASLSALLVLAALVRRRRAR